jgi:hypothetical protein
MSMVQTQVGEVNGKNASAIVNIDNGRTVREYQMYVGQSFIAIATGNAIKLRTPGKSFHNINDIGTHYKKDGQALLAVAVELKGMIQDAARA